MNLIKHQEKAEKAEHPHNRIMEIQQAADVESARPSAPPIEVTGRILPAGQLAARQLEASAARAWANTAAVSAALASILIHSIDPVS